MRALSSGVVSPWVRLPERFSPKGSCRWRDPGNRCAMIGGHIIREAHWIDLAYLHYPVLVAGNRGSNENAVTPNNRAGVCQAGMGVFQSTFSFFPYSSPTASSCPPRSRQHPNHGTTANSARAMDMKQRASTTV